MSEGHTYKLERRGQHTRSGARTLNDLHTLRRLLPISFSCFCGSVGKRKPPSAQAHADAPPGSRVRAVPLSSRRGAS
jgi:hypothetical protein